VHESSTWLPDHSSQGLNTSIPVRAKYRTFRGFLRLGDHQLLHLGIGQSQPGLVGGLPARNASLNTTRAHPTGADGCRSYVA